MDEDAEPKRKLACDSCRRKKLKCEWDDDKICNRCVQRKIRCIPHQVPRKRREKRPSTYLSSLEDRLRRMEAAMLKLPASMGSSRRSSQELEHHGVTDQLSALTINRDGVSIFVGASSGFSIISPLGIKWIAEVTGSDDFAKLVSDIPYMVGDTIGISNPNTWCKLPEEKRVPLPSTARAAALLDSFFHDGFHTVFPLFCETEILDRFSRDYPVDHEKDPAWYATLNLIFAASEIMAGKIKSPPASSDSPAPSQSTSQWVDVQEAAWWRWFQNGSSKFLDLQFMDGCLLAVQALTLMCFILQTFPNPYTGLVVVTSAMRLAQSIGLHRNLPFSNFTKSEFEQRKNVFWITFVIERQLLVRMGRPSIIHEDDIGIDLPQDTGVGGGFGHLRRMAQLTLIQGRIYNSLYSSKSLAKSRLERLQLAGMLDEEIQHWRDQLPYQIRPGSELTPPMQGTILPTIMMHFSYYHSLATIHRVSGQSGPWKDKEDDQRSEELLRMDINPRVFSGGAICIDAARSTIDLLKKFAPVFNIFDLNMIRVVAYYPLCASLLLFANVLQQPRHPQAIRDVEMMQSVTNFLSGYFIGKAEQESAFIIQAFMQINKLAEDFVQKSQNQNQGEKKGYDSPGSVKTNVQMSFQRESPSGNSVTVSRQQSVDNAQTTYIGHNVSQSLPQVNSTSSNLDPLPPQSKFSFPPQMQSVAGGIQQLPIEDSAADPVDVFGQAGAFNDPFVANIDPNWLPNDNFMMQPELFIPHDGSWFFPISNPMPMPNIETWDFSGQQGEHANIPNNNTTW